MALGSQPVGARLLGVMLRRPPPSRGFALTGIGRKVGSGNRPGRGRGVLQRWSQPVPCMNGLGKRPGLNL